MCTNDECVDENKRFDRILDCSVYCSVCSVSASSSCVAGQFTCTNDECLSVSASSSCAAGQFTCTNDECSLFQPPPAALRDSSPVLMMSVWMRARGLTESRTAKMEAMKVRKTYSTNF